MVGFTGMEPGMTAGPIAMCADAMRTVAIPPTIKIVCKARRIPKCYHRKWSDSEGLRRDSEVTAIKVEMLFRREAIKVRGVFALQHCKKPFCVWFAAFAEECFGGLKPGPTNELNVDVTSRTAE